MLHAARRTAAQRPVVRIPRLNGSRLNALRLMILRSGGLARRLAAALPAVRRPVGCGLAVRAPARRGCVSCGPAACGPTHCGSAPCGCASLAQRFAAQRPAAEDPAVRRLGSTPCGCASRGPKAWRLRLGGSRLSAPWLRILRPGGLRPNALRPSIPWPDALRQRFAAQHHAAALPAARLLATQHLAAALPAVRQLAAQGPAAASGCASCGPDAFRGPTQILNTYARHSPSPQMGRRTGSCRAPLSLAFRCFNSLYGRLSFEAAASWLVYGVEEAKVSGTW